MTLPKNKALRIGLLIVINLGLLIGLIIGMIFFQFLALGWGASANAPNFNIDIALIIYLIIVGLVVISQKNKERRSEIIWIGVIVTGLYVALQLGTQTF